MNKIQPHANSSKLMTSHGGYRELKSFQHAELVYDATVRFCDRFIDRRSRTHEKKTIGPTGPIGRILHN